MNATMASPLVLVDAYNIIYKWPRLKKWMSKGMLSRARDLLIYDLEELRALKGWRIEVVFDGYGRSTTGPLGEGPSGSNNKGVSKSDSQAKKKTTDHGVRVVYSGVGMSADGYIEQRCQQAKQITQGRITGSLIVASDDGMIRTAASSAGAICMGAERMVNELKSLRKSAMYRVEAALEQQQHHDRKDQLLNNNNNNNNNQQQKQQQGHSTVYRGSVIIEDKRNRKKKQKEEKEDSSSIDGEKAKMTLDDLKKGTKSVPSWAMVPDQTDE